MRSAATPPDGDGGVCVSLARRSAAPPEPRARWRRLAPRLWTRCCARRLTAFAAAEPKQYPNGRHLIGRLRCVRLSCIVQLTPPQNQALLQRRDALRPEMGARGWGWAGGRDVREVLRGRPDGGGRYSGQARRVGEARRSRTRSSSARRTRTARRGTHLHQLNRSFQICCSGRVRVKRGWAIGGTESNGPGAAVRQREECRHRHLCARYDRK